MNELHEGIDYTINEDGLFVFTREYHLKRGYCCGSNCLNCPYGNSVVRRDAPQTTESVILRTDQGADESTETDSTNRTDS